MLCQNGVMSFFGLTLISSHIYKRPKRVLAFKSVTELYMGLISSAIMYIIYYNLYICTTSGDTLQFKGLQTYANSVGQDQHAHPRSLTWELHGPLISPYNHILRMDTYTELELHCPHMSEGPFSHVKSLMIQVDYSRIYIHYILTLLSTR